MNSADKCRMLSKIRVDNVTGCWNWTAARQRDGYGRFWLDGKTRGAHRVSYRFFNKNIPDGLNVLHKCDNPPCINPGHLFLGTHQDNSYDKVAKGRGRCGVGSNNGGSKLTEDSVNTIKSLLYNSCRTQRSIGAMFGVSETAVSMIKSGKYWRDY